MSSNLLSYNWNDIYSNINGVFIDGVTMLFLFIIKFTKKSNFLYKNLLSEEIRLPLSNHRSDTQGFNKQENTKYFKKGIPLSATYIPYHNN